MLATDEEAGASTTSRSSTSEFKQASAAAGKKQYLVPYFIASHPGSDLDAMIDLALFLKRNHYRPDQVQDFIPSPFDIAACMYHTGLDPFTKKPVYVAKHLRDRKLQRALMQFFKPENYFEVRRALEQAGRQDLIGGGCDCLIPERPPKRRPRQAPPPGQRSGPRANRRRPHSLETRARLPPATQNGPARTKDNARRCSSCIRHPSAFMLPSATMYQLLDFGAGRKLERFGRYMLDRPAPAAAEARSTRRRSMGRGRWRDSIARTSRDIGPWPPPIDEPWMFHRGPLALELKLTEFGQVGLFPEQADNWDWIAEQVRAAGRPLRVLNLFAYTGASTLAAAAAGAEVTHVDAAAERRGLGPPQRAALGPRARRRSAGSPTTRRNSSAANSSAARHYDAVILDPPGYGHGPQGEVVEARPMHLRELVSDVPAN